MHGALPKAFFHLRSQADVEERQVGGKMPEVIVKNASFWSVHDCLPSWQKIIMESSAKDSV